MPYKFFCAVQNARSETVHGSDYALGFCSVRVSKINRNLEEFSGLHTSSTRFLESNRHWDVVMDCHFSFSFFVVL